MPFYTKELDGVVNNQWGSKMHNKEDTKIDGDRGFSDLDKHDVVVERVAMLAYLNSKETLGNALFPMVTFFDDLTKETHWAGETLEERQNSRDKYKAEKYAEAIENGAYITALDAPAGLLQHNNRDYSIKQALFAISLRNENAAIARFISEVDRRISCEKSCYVDNTPLRDVADENKIHQAYAERTFDAASLREEKSHERCERIQQGLEDTLFEMAIQLSRDSLIAERQKEIQSVEWIVGTDPLISRYINLGEIMPKRYDPSIFKYSVVTTLHTALRGRCFIVPRITFKDGMVQTFGLHVADMGRVHYRQDQKYHAIHHADELHTKLPIVGQLRIKNIETHYSIPVKTPAG